MFTILYLEFKTLPEEKKHPKRRPGRQIGD